jgi:hypothetical protein
MYKPAEVECNMTIVNLLTLAAVYCVVTVEPKAWGLNNLMKTLFLLQLLVGCTEERQGPHEEEIAAELYDHLIPPYVTSCSKVSLASAISLINR